MGRNKKDNEDDEDNGFAKWGGYMEAKKMKLMQQFQQSEKHVEKLSDIFAGIAIFVNGYTKPNTDELKILMAEHGGTYHTYKVPSTTHIIASNLPNVKILKLGSLPIIKPGWIVDSITLGRLLDYSKYLLYTNQSRTQPRLNFTTVEQDTNKRTLDREIVSEFANNSIESHSDTIPSTSNTSRHTKTASDPNFLEEFYGNSRLHLIATLGAEFKQLVNEMREKASEWKFVGLEKLIARKKAGTSSTHPIVMHIDMDCFFVSVGLRNRPELAGKPVAVTHSKGGAPTRTVDRQAEIDLYLKRLPDGAASRLDSIDNNSSLSEIASCSYEARRCGVKNGMFMGAALKLCPDLRAIPYDFQGYKDVSHTLYSTIAEYTLDIEAVSCDEMYVDCTKVLQKVGMGVDEWATHIRGEIMDRTQCPCSTGFGANRLQARLATKKAKPAGQYHLKEEEVEDYMFGMDLSELPGVGRATLAKLKNIGLETCGDVQMSSLMILQKELGLKAGETILEQAKGVDKKPLQYEHERKSVSAEVNFGIRFKQAEDAVTFLDRLSEEVHVRLSNTGMKAKCITLKLMVRAQDAPMETAKYLGHGVCDSLSRSSTLSTLMNDPKIIFREVKMLYEKLNVAFGDVRGVGIQLSRLEKGLVMNSLLKKFLSNPPVATGTKKEETNDNSLQLETTQLPIKSTVKPKSTGTIESKVGNKGRPKFSKSTKKDSQKSAVNLTNYFKSTGKNKAAVKPENFTTKISSKVDLDVLMQLPDDIRKEVMREYNLNEDFLTPATTTREETKNDESRKSIATTDQTSDDPSDFDSLTHDQFKLMLKSWLTTETEPLKCDIDMLATHFKKMARNRKIEQLHMIIKFFHRNIGETGNCSWHEAYFSVINATQEGMIMVYGNPLHLPTSFQCSNHN